MRTAARKVTGWSDRPTGVPSGLEADCKECRLTAVQDMRAEGGQLAFGATCLPPLQSILEVSLKSGLPWVSHGVSSSLHTVTMCVNMARFA